MLSLHFTGAQSGTIFHQSVLDFESVPKTNCKSLFTCITLVKNNQKNKNILNKYSKMYLKYMYVMLTILQIHIYVLNINTLQLYFWYTKWVYLKVF